MPWSSTLLDPVRPDALADRSSGLDHGGDHRFATGELARRRGELGIVDDQIGDDLVLTISRPIQYQAERQVDAAESPIVITDVLAALRKAAPKDVPAKAASASSTGSRGRGPKAAVPFRTFRDRDGTLLRVGKHAEGSDELTLHHCDLGSAAARRHPS